MAGRKVKLRPRKFDRRHGRRERQYSAEAFKMVLGLYASKKAVSAQDLCMISFFLGECRMPGEWVAYGKPPGLQSGKYKQHLDTLLPSDGPYYSAEVPCYSKNNPLQKSKHMLFRSIITVVSDEIRHSQDCQRFMTGADLDNPLSPGATPAYREHPRVVQSIEHGKPLPIPLAVYCDGVRITPVSAGRIDSDRGFLWPIRFALPGKV